MVSVVKWEREASKKLGFVIDIKGLVVMDDEIRVKFLNQAMAALLNIGDRRR